MDKPQRVSGPQFRADRLEEQQTVRTTIVGGRPPGSGQPLGPIPRGIEVLVKKASVDAEFKSLLLAQRSQAAGAIELVLEPSEAQMLDGVPGPLLEAIIAQTKVPSEHRRAFLGRAAAAMLAAIGAMGPKYAIAGLGIGKKAGIAWGGSGGMMADRPPEPVKPASDLAQRQDIDPVVVNRVVAIIAAETGASSDQMTGKASLRNDLKADTKQLKAIRIALGHSFLIELPETTFAKLETVGHVVEYVDAVETVGQDVLEIMARELHLSKGQIDVDMSLVADLEASLAQRAQMRRRLASALRVKIDWDEFKKLDTVDAVIGYVGGQVRLRRLAILEKKRSAGQRPMEQPVNPWEKKALPHGGSFGIRPH